MFRRTRIVSGVATWAVVAAGAGTMHVAAAEPTHVVHQLTFPDTMCGFIGTTQFLIIDNFGSLPGGATYDSGRLVQTFTADNGRAIRITYDAGHEYNEPPIVNADGTTSEIDLFSGLDALTQAVNGPVLEHGSGIVQVTLVFDANGHVLSASAIAIAGPNPNLTGAPDCSVIGPFLAG